MRCAKEFRRLLESTDKWDRRSSGLVITEASETTITVRATMSARNSDDAWDMGINDP